MLGKLASGMAHEVNNPLGGLFNALDTLRKHGRNDTIRRRSLDLLSGGCGNRERRAGCACHIQGIFARQPVARAGP